MNWLRWLVLVVIGLLAGCGSAPANQPAPTPTTLIAIPLAEVPAPTPTATHLLLPLVGAADTTAQAPPLLPYRVVASYPHDPRAWTQGLIVAGPGRLFEGTGDYANSSLREVELETGQVLRSVGLGDPALYGEGIARIGDRIFQLTWQNQRGLIYDVATFNQIGSFTYPVPPATMPREGWGLTYDGSSLIMSDGTATLYFIDPEATVATGQLVIERTVTVRIGDQPRDRLNELEYINGAIFANVWYSDQIVRIDPNTGQVTGILDLSGLLSPTERAAADVLNGIAYDQERGLIYVTGKYWPRLFAIALEQTMYLPLISNSEGQ
ncbi:MAG TPA: glutaminyl-peptide cyclotransferase [Chloroflexus aurantiacus]|uniref:Glutamine cyclotransferase n=1 Tax=Chloroflexus aurantiacus (strain ATCC 29366 / DSM 635 / J-10-fl) TaxID=324602 RepID=A9WGZ7_CHLAA|nr:glutaminyl-peptide cyclotransferase [Chloroflexus aurantiacus]ABY34092.1 glutamine cyclotransferase [Chloroflexus aurantiacus J-10-fl]HBW66223.1 glutaminyl-peptide cyclotransferase [Chloroflexus aurantiacus]